MKLVVAGDFLDDRVAVLFEKHKVADVVEEQFRRKKAAHHGFQFQLQAGTVVLVGDGAPGQHAFGIGRKRAHARRPAIADHQSFIAVEQVADLFLVGLQLVECVPDVGLLVGRVLQLQHRQGQAIDEDHQIAAPGLLVAGNGELVDHQELIVAGIGEVNQMHQIGFLFIPYRELHFHTRQ